MAGGIRFIVDINVGKLTRWLRIMGYDALSFCGSDDGQMVATALAEERVMLTRDTQVMERRAVTGGRLKAILIQSDKPEQQIQQVGKALGLDFRFRPFTICLECNKPLESRSKQEMQTRVPPYVFKTQHQYMECPGCHRVYWRGTHWEAMTRKLERLMEG
ncbi:Mut7-C RNAse domain-containing protein [Chloroflexota bacterium]